MIHKLQYDKFLELITENLQGDWVIIGGALLAVLNADGRATADIDMCPVGELTNEMRLELMDLAIKAGLPIEAINPSADFFLRQIPNWKSAIVPFKKGLKGTIFRPSLELYLKLKLNRGTDSDIQDCVSFIKWHKKNLLEIDSEKIRHLLKEYQYEKIQIIQDYLNGSKNFRMS